MPKYHYQSCRIGHWKRLGQLALACLVAFLPLKATSSTESIREPRPATHDQLRAQGGKANSHNDLAQLIRDAEKLTADGKHEQAILKWQDILSASKSINQSEDSFTAYALSNLGVLSNLLKRHKDAEVYFKRALHIYEGTLGPDHSATASAAFNLASSYRDQGLFSEAEPLFARALRLRESSLGWDHPETATALRNLASIYSMQRRDELAIELYERFLSLGEKSSKIDSFQYAIGLNDLAVLYAGQGYYSKAIPLLDRAIKIYTETLGRDHPRTAGIKANLGALYADIGAYAKAIPLLLGALTVGEKTYGYDSLNLTGILGALAQAYLRIPAYEKQVEPLLVRAISIHKKALGENHPSTASSINNLAVFYSEKGRHREAEIAYRRSLEIFEKALGPVSYEARGAYQSLAATNHKMGQLEEAQKFYVRSLEIHEKLGEPSYFRVFNALRGLALLHLLNRQEASSLPLVKILASSQDLWLRRELFTQPRELRYSLIEAQPDALATSFALLDQLQEAAQLALNVRLNRAGLLAEVERQQRLLLAGSKQTRVLAEQLALLDRKLSSSSLIPTHRLKLVADRQRLETELYRLLPEIRIDGTSSKQVAAALGEHAREGLLVEIQRYKPWIRNSHGGGEEGAPRYVALTLRPDGRITAIRLGDAAPIDTAIARAVDASAQGQEDALALWGQVSRLLFTPLQSELKGVKELFLSPDSELNRIPFAALPVGNDTSKLLSDVVQLRILTTGRDLVRLQTPAPAGASAPVVMANPQFDARGRRSFAGSGSAATASASPRQLRSAAQQTGRRQWDPLPATEKEAQVLAPLLKADKPITGNAATESRALALKSPRILHIASHGYFDPKQPAETQQRPAGGQLLGVANPSPLSEDPLLRSGIVLAGANHPDADPNDDGHLTAAEVTGMDLRNTELVTLSACETGLGSVRSGEGVYGLQRALTVAGSRSTLLSLWKVDDGATAAFMAEFYKRLMAGEGRADALRNTQAAFRTHSNEDYRDVYVWGAFQLTGDWRPLSTR